MIDIDVAVRQTTLHIDEGRLRNVAVAILADAGIETASLSIALVDDREIHQLNLRYLAHDETTDVLSFLLERGPGRLEGEVVASAEMALAKAADYGWPAGDELLLYVIHGILHLVGHDDTSDATEAAMRRAESRFLEFAGVMPRRQARGERDGPEVGPSAIRTRQEGDSTR